jgi:hypothetical protein
MLVQLHSLKRDRKMIIMLDTQGFSFRQVQGGKMTFNVADSPKWGKMTSNVADSPKWDKMTFNVADSPKRGKMTFNVDDSPKWGQMTFNVADSLNYEKFCGKMLSNTPGIRTGERRTSYKWASSARQRLSEGLCFRVHKIYQIKFLSVFYTVYKVRTPYVNWKCKLL